MAKVIKNEIESGEPKTLPIWERVQERMKQVPEAEIARLPTNAIAQHDHYLYRTKRNAALEGEPRRAGDPIAGVIHS